MAGTAIARRHQLAHRWFGVLPGRGWRKPDPRIYAQALRAAGADPGDCLFIGDNPVWDVEGPNKAGIRGMLLDRRMEFMGQGFDRVTCLREAVEKFSSENYGDI